MGFVEKFWEYFVKVFRFFDEFTKIFLEICLVFFFFFLVFQWVLGLFLGIFWWLFSRFFMSIWLGICVFLYGEGRGVKGEILRTKDFFFPFFNGVFGDFLLVLLVFGWMFLQVICVSF